jgi:ABC-type Co2+ transport system permease subunit
MFFIITFLLLSIWVFGGLIAVAVMLIRSLYHPLWDSYTIKEFIIGFIGSWYTVAILADIIKDEDL